MSHARYNYEMLFRHSGELALETRKVGKEELAQVRSAFAFLSRHFHNLEGKPTSHSRNVRMALSARFTNHLFSYVMLCERGLILDASNCSRSALETIAFYWLVCADPDSASLYDADESPRPVEIRKRLEALDIEVDELRSHYGFGSTVSHVGNKYDNLQIVWQREQEGKLQIGGGGSTELRLALLAEVPAYILLFARHDRDYIIERSGGKAQIREQ